MYLNNRTAAMLVYPTNSLGIELYYHANVFLCFGGKNKVTDHVSENTQLATPFVREPPFMKLIIAHVLEMLAQ